MISYLTIYSTNINVTTITINSSIVITLATQAYHPTKALVLDTPNSAGYLQNTAIQINF